MSKKPPIRPGITFEIGARLEAQDYLQKWYPSKIEKIDYEEGKMLVHFERWSSRYDEWINWDSNRIRPLERPALRKEGLKDDEENINVHQNASEHAVTSVQDFKEGEEVLARWTDCRYYPAKIEAINKEGTYTVQFYDGVIRCLKKMHLKYMPEDAKGQDWIALVKAAAAAAKNKAGNKPRTSVNSNKDKEEKKLHKALLKKEDASGCKSPSHQEEEPTSSRSLGLALEEDPALPLKQGEEEEIVLKRKIGQVSSFQAKRARLNKITGLLASKAVVLDDTEKKDQFNENPPREEEAITPKAQTQKRIDADICLSGTTVKPSLLPPSLSSGKARRKKARQEPDDVSGCKKFPLSNIDPQIKQGTPHSANLSRSTGRHKQRRRSRRLTPESSADATRIPHREGQGLPAYTQTPLALPVANVPDVAFEPQEKLEPLDLSRSAEIASPIVPKSSFHIIDCLPKEKEHLKLLPHPPRAIADGRMASATSVPELPVHPQHSDVALPNNVKPAKGSKKKKLPGCVSTDGSATSPSPAAGNKLSDVLQEKIIKKLNEKDKHAEVGAVKSEKKGKTEDKTSSGGKKKDKDKDWKDKKDKDHFKPKKKKKKKKKSKQNEYSDYEDSSIEFIERRSSPVMRSPSSTPNNTLPTKSSSLQFPCAILSVDLTGENLSDMEFLDDSSTESLILSGDEYNLEFDSTNFEESQDEEEAINEIVRCICEMDEENGFMIQCEECLCWQHSVCMGLLEDSIPEQYICYVCSDPPGQRWSAKYRYDRDWFNNGHMCGLSFINENYSYLNAKKIVSTHHLLADVYGVTEILHGLQLKFGILKNKDHPDLRLWAYPSKQWESGQANEKRAVASSNERGLFALNHKGPTTKAGKMEETYITSEHSYQKPQSSGNGGKPINDSGKSEDDGGVLPEGQKTNFQTDTKKNLSDPLNIDRRNNQGAAEELCNDKRGGEEQGDSHLQWQLNLLTHIESVQNEVTNHMDLIEKEVDVLESWLDFTGELEPPDPLARLPQLKRRIKQLLVDMGKVQQIATLCSV